MSTLDKIFEEINKAESIVILTHENPDGDAVGTSLALYNALKLYGKNNVDVIIPECPKTFNFLGIVLWLFRFVAGKQIFPVAVTFNIFLLSYRQTVFQILREFLV